jgi:hypothetical protein
MLQNNNMSAQFSSVLSPNRQHGVGNRVVRFMLILSIIWLFLTLCIIFHDYDYRMWGTNEVGFITISTNTATHHNSYTPSRIESYFLDHGRELGIDSKNEPARGCAAWADPTSPIATELAAFKQGMKLYQKLAAMQGEFTDLRRYIQDDHHICDSLELHPDGLRGIFLNETLTQTRNGLLEPLFPPMRDPNFCSVGSQALLSLDYLIHDFASYCRSLKPYSRIILLDIGASLDFHQEQGEAMPVVYLTEIYQKFGFHWDHIYAYEATKTEPAHVFQKVPEKLMHAYHWINVGVDPDKNSKLNPWNMLLQEYNEDEFCSSLKGAMFFYCLLTFFTIM